VVVPLTRAAAPAGPTRARRARGRGLPDAAPSPAELARAASIAAIRTLVAALGRSARSIEWRTGFTNAQLFLLRQLAVSDGLSVNELAERARTSQSTVSTVLGRIIRAGLVSRRNSPTDGRRLALSITPKGRRLVRRAPTPPTEALFDALESLTDREARALETGLTALLAALDLHLAEPPMLFEDAARRRPD